MIIQVTALDEIPAGEFLKVQVEDSWFGCMALETIKPGAEGKVEVIETLGKDKDKERVGSDRRPVYSKVRSRRIENSWMEREPLF